MHSVAGRAPAAATARTQEEAEMEAEFVQGMHALIVGALAMHDATHQKQ